MQQLDKQAFFAGDVENVEENVEIENDDDENDQEDVEEELSGDGLEKKLSKQCEHGFTH